MLTNTKKEVETSGVINEENNEANKEYLEFSGKNAYNIDNMNNKKSYYKLILVGIIFFIIGFVVSDVLNKGGAGQGFITGEDDKIIVNEDENDNGEKDVESYNRKVSLETRDQLFGGSVLVFDIFLDKTSWIAVYEDISGQPGNILGAGILDSGNVLSYEIELLRNTVGDAKYYVKIHPDNGDRIFNHKEDLSLNDVVYSFKTISGRSN